MQESPSEKRLLSEKITTVKMKQYYFCSRLYNQAEDDRNGGLNEAVNEEGGVQ